MPRNENRRYTQKTLIGYAHVPIVKGETEANIKPRAFFLVSVAFFAFSRPAFPATVTIAILQNGAAPAIAIEMSRTIEDELFDQYFDAGHIVSNAVIGSGVESFDDPYYGVKDATLGDSDFLIVSYFEYGPAIETNTEKKLSWAVLNSIKWRVVRLDIMKGVVEGSMFANEIKVMDSDPYNQSRFVADELGKRTLAAIQAIIQGEKTK